MSARASKNASAGETRAVKWLLATVVLGSGGLLAGSCVDVLGLGYSDTASELCAMLDRCYPGKPLALCADRLEDNLAGGTAGQRDDFLRFFAGADCLSSCTAARDCLDREPVCELSESECGSLEECCGFTTGAVVCEGRACCKKVGAPCERSEECCGEVACENNQQDQRTCGGAALCGFVDELCVNDVECCTNICLNGVCGPLCKIDGSCSQDKECCSQVCDDGECRNPPVCAPMGQGCQQTECCDADATCYQGVCLAECFVDQQDCSSNAQCCSGWCDPVTFTCGPLTCLQLESPCDLPNLPPEAQCCGELECGGSHLCRCAGPADIAKDCADEVCLVAPSCCCEQWDEICDSLGADLSISCLSSLP